jgi:hypothetical protein
LVFSFCPLSVAENCDCHRNSSSKPNEPGEPLPSDGTLVSVPSGPKGVVALWLSHSASVLPHVLLPKNHSLPQGWCSGHREAMKRYGPDCFSSFGGRGEKSKNSRRRKNMPQHNHSTFGPAPGALADAAECLLENIEELKANAVVI